MSKLELVEHENDVRQPLPGLAGRRRRRRQTVVDRAVGFHQPARRDVEQRQRAGAGELRHVVGGLERLLAVHRHREGQRRSSAARQSNGAERRRSGAAPGTDRATTAAPAAAARSRRPRRPRDASPGNTVSRNEMVSASISMTSTKLALMIRTSCLNCDSRISTTIMTSDSAGRDRRPPQHHKPDEVEQPPGEQERQPRNQVVLGVQQDAERRQVQQHQHGSAQTRAQAGRKGQLGAMKKANAGGMLPVPRPDLALLQPAADRCHHSVINAPKQGPPDVAGGPIIRSA